MPASQEASDTSQRKEPISERQEFTNGNHYHRALLHGKQLEAVIQNPFQRAHNPMQPMIHSESTLPFRQESRQESQAHCLALGHCSRETFQSESWHSSSAWEEGAEGVAVISAAVGYKISHHVTECPYCCPDP